MSGEAIYTAAVGKKFNRDGTFRKYPGLTVISKIGIKSFESNLIKQWQRYFTELPFSAKFTFLPHSSFHMTVFELLNDQARVEELWSRHLKLDAPMNEIDSFIRMKFDEIKRPDKIKMKVNGCASDSFIYVMLEPLSEVQFNVLKKYRNELSEKTGIRKPGHDEYKFHITFAYKIINLEKDEELQIDGLTKELNEKFISEMPFIEFSSPELCFYSNMSEFHSDFRR